MDDEKPTKAEQKVLVDVGVQNPSNLSTKGLIMVCTGSILLVGCIIIIIFYLYSLKRNRNSHRSHHLVRNNRVESSSEDAISLGLEPSILRTLSDFRFGSSKYGAGVGAVPPKECAVCLSEFEDDEIGRVLPNCKHSFHLQCIDIWFKFNSNCPLCRTQVQPAVIIKNNIDDDDVVVVGLESGLSSVLNHPSPVSQSEEVVVVVVEEDDDQMVICSTSTSEDKKPPELTSIIWEAPVITQI